MRNRIALCACASLVACAEGPEPFVPPDREAPSGPAWRVTFNPANDRAPIWTGDGTRLIYSAESLAGANSTQGLLLEVPFERGEARRPLTNVQDGTTNSMWLTTPALAPDGERLAFGHVISVSGSSLCGFDSYLCVPPPGDPVPLPRLDKVTIRVRRFDAGGPLSQNPSLELELAGRAFDGTRHPGGLPGVWLIDLYAFHQVYNQDATLFFRPSWSPDGRRIAFSDGLSISIWNLDDGSVVPIAGTDDGTAPAWSPDGEWIAFVRYETVPDPLQTCEFFVSTIDGPVLTCFAESTLYSITSRRLVLVRPDGSETVDLGEGEEPSWTPDGGAIFFRRDDRIWRQPLGGGDPVAISDTDGGREPAVSPDGRYLAYARRDANDIYSIWVATLLP